MDRLLHGIGVSAVILLMFAVSGPASAQRHSMDMPATAAPSSRPPSETDAQHDMAAMGHGAMGNGMAMSGMTMQGMLGRYPMARESSGTAWQPDSSPIRSAMFQVGGWSLMGQGFATLLYDRQGGRRGDSKVFSTSMAMLMGYRDVSPADRIGLRAMVSLDPAMGARGYPLLFATGESADGRTKLVDRQHPHDLFMELAASWSHDIGAGRALSLYAGLPGEPALGPPTFMHRISGMSNPEAPIGHHWFDSTHITYGVVTAGFSGPTWKIEGSGFKGREPDQHRWDIEAPKLDSWSVRAFWNPTINLSLQASTGHLHSPEALEPDTDEQRTTASVTLNIPWGEGSNWATTIAWSSKHLEPGPRLTGLLAESAFRFGPHEIFGRAEREQENELFGDGPLAHRIYRIAKFTLGYQHEIPLGDHLKLALGGLASGYAYPSILRADYGRRGVKSVMIYGRLRFGE